MFPLKHSQRAFPSIMSLVIPATLRGGAHAVFILLLGREELKGFL